MIRKDKKVFHDGTVKTQIRVTQGYRPYPSSSTKQRTVKSFGYLEDQTDLEAFWKEVNACNDSLKKERNLRIEIPISEQMYTDGNRVLNYGYKYPESVYRTLKIDSFFDQFQKKSGFSGRYSLKDAFRRLVMDRILYPFSRQDDTQNQLSFYGLENECRLPDLYHALDQYQKSFLDLQKFLNDKVRDKFGRDLQCGFTIS